MRTPGPPHKHSADRINPTEKPPELANNRERMPVQIQNKVPASTGQPRNFDCGVGSGKQAKGRAPPRWIYPTLAAKRGEKRVALQVLAGELCTGRAGPRLPRATLHLLMVQCRAECPLPLAKIGVLRTDRGLAKLSQSTGWSGKPFAFTTLSWRSGATDGAMIELANTTAVPVKQKTP